MNCMENLRFSSHHWAKGRRQGPPGSARAQPCMAKKKKDDFASVLSEVRLPAEEFFSLFWLFVCKISV